MKFLVKLFIYLTIFVIISVFNNAYMVQAKSQKTMDDLKGMDEPPEKVPEFAATPSRIRRDVDSQTADGDDVPQDEPNVRFRDRRDAPPEESDVPQKFQEEPKTLRAKRQMPPPPGEIPMPPM